MRKLILAAALALSACTGSTQPPGTPSGPVDPGNGHVPPQPSETPDA